ncbi:acyl-CoA carboxylase subunit epsilon [Intrasporangium flavum]|uniref:acyl-CoA carboxylase subunit epsilon n=1 Tax=Intrasporangium flavum TaxID=1428657 RepID=UPI00096F698F|nr:acyl-CoA carboxylase subunit epsilon [Intrasporangium flavum]
MSTDAIATDAIATEAVATDAPTEAPPEPALRIVHGDPTPEELAALVAVLSALGGAEDAEPPRRRSPWSDPRWRLVGASARRDGWRTSALPR